MAATHASDDAIHAASPCALDLSFRRTSFWRWYWPLSRPASVA